MISEVLKCSFARRSAKSVPILACNALIGRWRKSGEALEVGGEIGARFEAYTVSNSLYGVVAEVVGVVEPLAGFLHPAVGQHVGERLTVGLVDNLRDVFRLGVHQFSQTL